MPVCLVQRIFSVLLVAAYLSASIFAVAPLANATPVEMSGGMMMTQDSSKDEIPMPCKGIKTGCITQLGCVFMVSLPALDPGIGTRLAWSPVTYTVSPDFRDGRSNKPTLGPPISRA